MSVILLCRLRDDHCLVLPVPSGAVDVRPQNRGQDGGDRDNRGEGDDDEAADHPSSGLLVALGRVGSSGDLDGVGFFARLADKSGAGGRTRDADRKSVV